MNEQQRQAYLDQIDYGRIERVIAYKNVQFIIDHQHDTREQLSAYLKSCTERIGHPPAVVEVIGGEYIEYRFGSWQTAIRSFYSGKITEIIKMKNFKRLTALLLALVMVFALSVSAFAATSVSTTEDTSILELESDGNTISYMATFSL